MLTNEESAGNLAELSGSRVRTDTAEIPAGWMIADRPGFLVALVGVLLSGGAYVPLDPGLPALRLTETARAAGVACVVADNAGRAVFARTGLSIVDIPEAGPAPVALA